MLELALKKKIQLTKKRDEEEEYIDKTRFWSGYVALPNYLNQIQRLFTILGCFHSFSKCAGKRWRMTG